ncbi:DUF1573 domain-containing protein [Blastopirellula marina]|uniref:DUF1573 domain-containing protein n=1 Tax=Blastopirellula marina DSM 3645 TaxID=314230 RepID=A3ZWW0_9BACT|nr:DUF1573 domain-containing protein [Blastopirellula marina]EAQ79084.1 hypothetical protein DSM3645_14010 [Blastopirellula marina DSM 3645]
MFDKIPLVIAIAVLALLGAWWVMPSNPAPTASLAVATSNETTQPSNMANSRVVELPVESSEPQPQPQVEAERTEYNFGSMERFESSSHTFKIRNIGDAPLRLEVGDSSCSCTLAGLEESDVPPGEKTHIKLEWTLKFKEGPFRQSATILTNDPSRPEIQFAVEGIIEEAVKIVPRELVLSGISAGEPVSRMIEIIPAAFEIGDVIIEDESSIHPLTVRLLPRTDQNKNFRLAVNVPDTLPSGHFQKALNILISPADPEKKSIRRTLKIAGNLTGGYVVLSPNMRKDGIYEIPPINKKGSHEYHAIIRIRDSEKKLKIKSLKCRPEFVTAKLEPQPETSIKGLYKLTMTVSPDAPNGVYRGTGGGDVIIQLDHPRIERIRFYLECAINR